MTADERAMEVAMRVFDAVRKGNTPQRADVRVLRKYAPALADMPVDQPTDVAPLMVQTAQLPPAAGECDPSKPSPEARSSYTADYYFYAPAK